MEVSLWSIFLAGRELSAEDLAAAGLLSFAGGGTEARTGAKNPTEGVGVVCKSQTALVSAGTGLQALPRKTYDRIRAGEYVDFMDLPPARGGRSRQASQVGEGHLLLVQAVDLASSRRIIPDLATWLQCFALYAAVLAKEQPGRIQELMAYQTAICRAAQKYKWPSWVVYDQTFRQEAAGSGSSWAKVDPSTFSLCFTGQARNAEN